MAYSLSMPLDDRIKNRSNRGRGRGRGRDGPGREQGRTTGVGRTTAAVRSGPLMVNVRPSSHAIAKSLLFAFSSLFAELGLFHGSTVCLKTALAAGIRGVEVGTKLYVSNLDHGVTNEDIRDLFSEIGDLKRYALHYDNNGHPNGSAEVVYARRSDAFSGLKRYNNVLLDGKPMVIEIVGANAELPITAHVNVTGVNGQRKRTVVMTPGEGRSGGPAALNRGVGGRHGGARLESGGIGRNRGLGRGRDGSRGQGRRKKDGVEKSAEELDKELETYHAEAMHIS